MRRASQSSSIPASRAASARTSALAGRAAIFVTALVGVSGCGPSLRVVHESTVYFERCHAAELHDEVPLETKTECWERWLRWYGAAQTGTRVLYARERLVYLAQGELVDPLATGESAAAEVAEESEPTSGGSTSGSGASSASGSASGAAAPSSGAGSSGPPPARANPGTQRPIDPRRSGHSVCAPVCRPRWEACVTACDRSDRSCVGACQTEYGACMDGCI